MRGSPSYSRCASGHSACARALSLSRRRPLLSRSSAPPPLLRWRPPHAARACQSHVQTSSWVRRAPPPLPLGLLLLRGCRPVVA